MRPKCGSCLFKRLLSIPLLPSVHGLRFRLGRVSSFLIQWPSPTPDHVYTNTSFIPGGISFLLYYSHVFQTTPQCSDLPSHHQPWNSTAFTARDSPASVNCQPTIPLVPPTSIRHGSALVQPSSFNRERFFSEYQPQLPHLHLVQNSLGCSGPSPISNNINPLLGQLSPFTWPKL